MNEKLMEQIRENMESKSTVELLRIWEQNDRDQWSDATFEVIQTMLIERGESLPAQLEHESAASKNKVVAVCFPNNEIKVYRDHDRLREEVIRGNVKKDYKARLISRLEEGANNSKETDWSTFEEISNADFKLQTLYKPIWAHTMKGMGYGAIGGIVLKALDTTWLIFQTDQITGFFWLLVVASLFVAKWSKWALLVPIMVSSKLGINVNLFITFLSVMIVGAIFGGPVGMVFGTIVGFFRARNITKAPDSCHEGAKTYLMGLLAPSIFLVVAIAAYLFWLMPKMVHWLS